MPVIQIPSETRKNVSYTIKDEGRSLTCSCPRFTYRREICKHMRSYVKHLHLDLSPASEAFDKYWRVIEEDMRIEAQRLFGEV